MPHYWLKSGIVFFGLLALAARLSIAKNPTVQGRRGR